MPYRRRFKRRFRRYRRRYRRFRRYGRRKGMRMTVRKMPMFYPDKLRVPLQSALTVSPADAGGGTFKERYYLNSAYDPWGTDGTTYAGEFTTWSAMYQTYLVTSCSIQIRLVTKGTEPAMVVVYPSNSPNAVADANTANLQKYKKGCQINFSGTSIQNQTIYNRIAVRKLFGRRLYDEDFFGGIGANPDFVAYWHLIGTTTDGTVDDLTLYIKMVQMVTFCEYQIQTQDSNT